MTSTTMPSEHRYSPHPLSPEVPGLDTPLKAASNTRLKITQIVACLRCHHTEINRWINAEGLLATKQGKSWVIDCTTLIAYTLERALKSGLSQAAVDRLSPVLESALTTPASQAPFWMKAREIVDLLDLKNAQRLTEPRKQGLLEGYQLVESGDWRYTRASVMAYQALIAHGQRLKDNSATALDTTETNAGPAAGPDIDDQALPRTYRDTPQSSEHAP